MTNIEIEHDTTDIHTDSDPHSDPHEQSEDELVKDDAKDADEQPNEQPLQELNKPVKQLTKAERELIINEFNNGGDNKYYKVHKLKNGSIRITKRANPLTNKDDESLADAHENVNKRIDNKLNTKRLTDNQLLLEHIIDLEKRYEVMRMKHKKLKKRYNKLECDLFDDDSDEPLNIKEITVDNAQDNEEKPVVEPVVEAPVEALTVRRPIKKGSWRTVVSGF
jgi:hypothetical protein